MVPSPGVTSELSDHTTDAGVKVGSFLYPAAAGGFLIFFLRQVGLV